MSANDDPIERFLAQPPLHSSEEAMPQATAPTAGRARRSLWSRVNSFLFEKRAGSSSSIAPRRDDGSRTDIFPFNGGGRGR